MPRTIKGLFISHVPASSIYGAATSFRLMMDHLPKEIEGSLILPKRLNPLRDHNRLRDAERALYPSRFDIHMERLPYDNCYQGGETNLPHTVSAGIQNGVALLSRHRLHRLIRDGGFDFVYLNSLVLNPLIHPNIPFFLHVREVYRGHNKKRHERIASARGLIFIDNRTRDALIGEVATSNSIVLNNPVDMLEVARRPADYRTFFKDLGLPPLPESTKLFSYIGTISPIKGVDIIVKAFAQAAPENAQLLILGKTTDPSYLAACKAAAQNAPNIHFLGEIENMLPIYRHTDYVIRGDPDFRIGRTVFEGLFAGCDTILPGRDGDFMRFADLSRFEDRVFFYSPGDTEALARLFGNCAQRDRPERTYHSNVPIYIQAITEFLQRSLNL